MISVIVVNYDSARLTGRAVRSVFQEAEDHEVIIVDNTASEEEKTRLQALFPGNVHLIFNKRNEGFARACNTACALSRGDWIFLLNPDSYILPGALKRLREFMAVHPQAGAAGPKIYWDDRKTFLLPPSRFPSATGELFSRIGGVSRAFSACDSMRHRRRSLTVWTSTSPSRQEALSGGHVMIRRAALEKCGGLFDERFFMYYEDSDLMLRLREAGYELFVVPQAEVVHNYIHDAGKMDLMGKSKGLYFDKHFRDSLLMKMANAVPRERPEDPQRGFMDAGKTESPLRIEIPQRLQKRWLFEWSPSRALMPSVGCFGNGPLMAFPQDAWDMLGPGRYYGRISPPKKIVFSSVLWMWEKV
jgi:GT2 family glycosyltransferase